MKNKRFKKVYIEITNVCNLKCKFCPDTKRVKKFMTFDEFKHIANQVINYTDLITLHVKGEPLIHPELGNILEYCKEIGLKVNITTNGVMLDKVKEIFSIKSVRQLNISLHSMEQNGLDNKEYLDKVFSSIDYIRKNNPDVYISYRLWNIKNIADNNNIEVIDVLKDKYSIENLMNLVKENEFVKLDNNVFLNQDIEFVWPNIDGDIISEEGTCQGLRVQIAILANGEVVPCCMDQDADILLGNIFENRLEDILNSQIVIETIKGFENNKLIHKLCKKCGFRCRFDN